AALMLEGSPRERTQNGPIRAPLPRGSAAVLNRFWDSDRPFKSLESVRKALRALHERPSRVNRPRRFVQVIILALLAIIPFSCIWSILFFGPLAIAMGSVQINEYEYRSLEITAQVDLASALVRPNPFERIEGARQYALDLERIEEARKRAEVSRKYF